MLPKQASPEFGSMFIRPELTKEATKLKSRTLPCALRGITKRFTGQRRCLIGCRSLLCLGILVNGCGTADTQSRSKAFAAPMKEVMARQDKIVLLTSTDLIREKPV